MLRRFVVLAALVLALPASATAAPCTTTVSSTSAAASAVSAAAPGATVCLADGTYGTVSLNATKAAPGVTLQAEHPGQANIGAVSLAGARLTLAQFNVTGEVDLVPGSSGMVVDHNRITGGYMGVNMATSSTQVNDFRITGNKFQGPFGEDAIRLNRYHDADGDGVGALIEGNEFTNIRENGNHSDCLQAVWVGDHLIYRKNYLHDNQCQGFFIKDQASAVDTVVAEDNLMLRNNAGCGPPATSCGQPSIFQLFGPMTNLTVRRNTIWTPGGGSPTTLRNPGWGGVRLFDSNVISRPWSDTTAPFGFGYSAMNNVTTPGRPEGTWPATGFTTNSSPPFANPAADDYRTNDGRGVTWAPADQVYGPGATSPPPPPPSPQCSDGADNDGDGLTDFPNDPGCTSATDDDETNAPPPPVDHQPTARFTASPEPSAPGQAVTFDATASTCEDTPCVYHWHDIGPPPCASGIGNWPLGPDGSTMTFTFTGTGTKCVELIVTDVDGDVDKVEHDHVVSTAPPPPPPSLEIAGLAQDDTGDADRVTFTWEPPAAAVARYDLTVDGDAWWEHPTGTRWWVGSPSWECGTAHAIGLTAVGTDGRTGPQATATMTTAAC